MDESVPMQDAEVSVVSLAVRAHPCAQHAFVGTDVTAFHRTRLLHLNGYHYALLEGASGRARSARSASGRGARSGSGAGSGAVIFDTIEFWLVALDLMVCRCCPNKKRKKAIARMTSTPQAFKPFPNLLFLLVASLLSVSHLLLLASLLSAHSPDRTVHSDGCQRHV